MGHGRAGGRTGTSRKMDMVEQAGHGGTCFSMARQEHRGTWTWWNRRDMAQQVGQVRQAGRGGTWWHMEKHAVGSGHQQRIQPQPGQAFFVFVCCVISVRTGQGQPRGVPHRALGHVADMPGCVVGIACLALALPGAHSHQAFARLSRPQRPWGLERFFKVSAEITQGYFCPIRKLGL